MRIQGGAAQPSYGPNRQFVRLGLRDEHKRLGIGEASPLPPFAADVASALAVLLGEALPNLATTRDDLSPREAVAAALVPVERALAPYPAARFAAETALFDVVGLRRGLSVAACLAGADRLATVPTNALLDASAPDLVERARGFAEAGLHAVKVKLRARDEAGFARELAALRALRKTLPPPFELRLDPNGAWTIPEAQEKLVRLAEVAPRYVEQPVPAALLPDLGPAAVPWAADESLLLPGMAERLARAAGCAAFILKPAALGGLDRALAVAAIGAEAGLDLVVTHFADGPVGLAAAAELARALPKPPLACGLEPHAGLSTYPAMAIPQRGRSGTVREAALPGLGFSEEARNRWITTD
ncbi:mandelate racemase/muconate lactonizing enzyme family protein [Polyangium fumosum]|uniref:O-succinylbenzoate synthase n=1 Tax=Polyangium fumosum TaxID=889272 RepID=A0A4U1JAH3_9BACT|nr:enolase C-terminal domain-like protein [Polyangium fumosum]TKD05259.1 O-succinylbenzoate synthase [Polyangium fumosum]